MLRKPSRDHGFSLELVMEKWAALEHERWAHWQKYLHSQCETRADGALIIPAASVAHWEHQIATRYSELTEKEKDSDRKEVEKYIPSFAEALTTLEAALREYGEHKTNCAKFHAMGAMSDPPCTCGLDRALTQTEEKP